LFPPETYGLGLTVVNDFIAYHKRQRGYLRGADLRILRAALSTPTAPATVPRIIYAGEPLVGVPVSGNKLSGGLVGVGDTPMVGVGLGVSVSVVGGVPVGVGVCLVAVAVGVCSWVGFTVGIPVGG